MRSVGKKKEKKGIPTNSKGNYKDVSPTHWAAEAIKQLSARGIMTGTSATTFNPDATLTHAEAVKVLNLLFERLVTKGALTYNSGSSNHL